MGDASAPAASRTSLSRGRSRNTPRTRSKSAEVVTQLTARERKSFAFAGGPSSKTRVFHGHERAYAMGVLGEAEEAFMLTGGRARKGKDASSPARKKRVQEQRERDVRARKTACNHALKTLFGKGKDSGM